MGHETLGWSALTELTGEPVVAVPALHRRGARALLAVAAGGTLFLALLSNPRLFEDDWYSCRTGDDSALTACSVPIGTAALSADHRLDTHVDEDGRQETVLGVEAGQAAARQDHRHRGAGVSPTDDLTRLGATIFGPPTSSGTE